jgi:hypothetical protein
MLKERWETTWGKWLNGRRPVEVTEVKVCEGDRFYRRSNANHVWIVDRVYTPLGQTIPHARAFRMDEKSDSRLWSQASLLNRTDFARDRRKVQQGEPEEFARRRLDKPGGNMRSRLEVQPEN